MCDLQKAYTLLPSCFECSGQVLPAVSCFQTTLCMLWSMVTVLKHILFEKINGCIQVDL